LIVRGADYANYFVIMVDVTDPAVTPTLRVWLPSWIHRARRSSSTASRSSGSARFKWATLPLVNAILATRA
jgi:hypothetical protein